MKTPRITYQRQQVLDYVVAHPGCCAAEVDRDIRTARKGHRWMYAVIKRMLRVGLLIRCEASSKHPNAMGLKVA